MCINPRKLLRMFHLLHGVFYIDRVNIKVLYNKYNNTNIQISRIKYIYIYIYIVIGSIANSIALLIQCKLQTDIC